MNSIWLFLAIFTVVFVVTAIFAVRPSLKKLKELKKNNPPKNENQ